MTIRDYNGCMPRSRAHKAFDVPTEAQEQTDLVEYLQWRQLTPVHIPNGGKRSVQGHVLAKKIGECAGFPDLMILDRPPNAPTQRVFIEMKRTKGGTLSEKQSEWMQRITDNGDIHILAKGCDHALEQLRELDTGWRL